MNPKNKKAVKSKENPAQGYDVHGNADHYKGSRIENIDMMERIWGTYETMVFCEMNAFKYRARLGKKDQPLELELIKIKWYDDKAKELQAKLGTYEEINHSSIITKVVV